MPVYPLSWETQPTTVQLWTEKALCVDLKVSHSHSVPLVSNALFCLFVCLFVLFLFFPFTP